MNHALIMGSLSLTLLIPALVTLAALIPLGRQNGIAADLAHRMGLSAQATRDLQSLFPTSGTAAGAATGFSAVATIVFAIGWPAELQRGYQSIWSLPARGLRDTWRLLVWLVSFFSLVALVVGVGALVSGAAGVALTAALGAPVSFVWAWWTQHLLLGGRVPWRALLPGAIATSATLLGFRLVMYFYLPVSIVENEKRYGALGVVFAMLSWVIGFSFVMLGGPLAGHTIFVRRRSRMSDADAEPCGGLSTGSRDREPAE